MCERRCYRHDRPESMQNTDGQGLKMHLGVSEAADHKR